MQGADAATAELRDAEAQRGAFPAVPTLALSAEQFRVISETVHSLCGIRLQAGKKEGLVRTRLGKRVRELGLEGFSEYLERVTADGSGRELAQMVDLLTTNKTSFFREPQHFEYLHQHVLPGLTRRGGGGRIWSAGCSSGEEPYTLAMMLCESMASVDSADVRILATDISERALARAREGVYARGTLQDVPAPLRTKYFAATRADQYRATDSLRRVVRFARLNLLAEWPMRGPFDAIFCRNVMIYFDGVTRERLIQRFWDLLPPGGHLFVGHAESLAALTHGFRYVQPAVYVK